MEHDLNHGMEHDINHGLEHDLNHDMEHDLGQYPIDSYDYGDSFLCMTNVLLLS